MLARKNFSVKSLILLLIGYTLGVTAYALFILTTHLSELLLFVLIIPIVFSAILFGRYMYLTMVAVGLIISIWLISMLPINFGKTAPLLVVVAVIVAIMSEVIHYLIMRQQQAEQSLKRTEANLKALLNSNLQSFVLIGKDYTVQAFNKIAVIGAEQILGKSLFEGASFLEFVDPSNLEGFKHNFSRALKGEALLVETNVVGKDGKDNWAEFSYSPVIAENGQVSGVCFSVLDITARKKAVEALAQSEARFRTLVQNSSDIITILDKDNIIRYISPGMEATLGYSPEFMLGKNSLDFIHPEDVAVVEAAFLQGQIRSDTPFRYEFRFRTATDQWVYLEAVGNNLLDDPNIHGVVVNTRDITDRKHAEERLRLNEKLYHTLAEVSPVGLFRTTVTGECFYVSEAWSEISGINTEEAVGTGWLRAIYSEDRELVSIEWDRAVKEKRPFRLEYRFQHQSTGVITWVLGQAVAERDKDGEVLSYIGTITNITLRKQTEELLQVESEYLAALHETALGLMNRLELSDSLQTIINRAALLLGTNHGYITLVEERRGEPELAMAVTIGLFNNFPDFRVKPGVGLGGLVWQTGQPLAITDYGSWEGRVKEFGSEAYQGLLGVPLKADGRVIGVIALAFTEKTRKIGEAEIERLSQFAQLASIALDNARLYTAFRRRLSELTTVQQVAKAINSSLRLEEVFQTVVNQISSAFGYEMVSIYLRQGNKLALQAYVGYDQVMWFISLEEAVSGRVVRSGQAAFIQNAAEDPDFIIVAPGTNQAIIIPLKTGDGQVLGTLLVESKGQPNLTEEDFSLLTLLADQVSVAVENARLFVEQRQSEEKYREVVNSVKEIIFKLDNQGNWIFLNPAWQEIMGYSVEETLGTNYLGYIHFADHRLVLTKYSALLSGEVKDEHIEIRLTTKQGVVKWIEAFARRQDTAQGEFSAITGTLIDITARRQAEDERLLLERKLLEAQKLESLGVLAGGIAHDFNNLLVGILGNAELARLELPESSEPIRKVIEQIEIAAQRAADLTRQMLAYSGRGRFVVQHLHLNQVIEEMGQLLKASIKKMVTLQYSLSPELPEIEADATQIRQVVMNLIVNASDAIGEAEGTVTVSTGVIWADQEYLAGTYLATDVEPGNYVYFEVADTGSGIDKANLARIFEPFFTTKFTGRGLGLAAVLGIVRGHKGALSVASEPGQGTTFRILLPCLEVENSTTQKPALPNFTNKDLITVHSPIHSSPPVVPALSSIPRTVLVVDDEPMVRTMTQRILERFGFRVITAVDGRDGVDTFCAQSTEIDCVILDLTMPQLNGEEALREIKRCKPEVKVILMSGFSEQEATQRFAEQGLAGFLQKPFTVTDLRAAVNEALSEVMVEN